MMNREEKKGGASVRVEVNVTKIVKYACMTGVMVVAIIFGSRIWADAMKGNHSA